MKAFINKIKLADISQGTLIFSSVVYIFGFLSVNSYLFSLNFMSLELVNTKYITAGLFMVMSLILALLISLKYLNILDPINPKKDITWWTKISLQTFIMVGSCWTFSYIFASLFGVMPKPSSSAIQFNQSDFVAKLINYAWHTAPGVGKLSLWIFIYLTIIVSSLIGIVWILVVIFNFINNRFHLISLNEKVKKEHLQKSNKTPFAVTVAKICSIPVAIFVFIYVFVGFSTHIVTIDQIGKVILGSSDYFTWLYLTVVGFSVNFWVMDFEKFRKEKNIFITLVNDPMRVIYPMGLTILLSIFYFGLAVYPRIPSYLGGGNVKNVNVVSRDYTNILSKFNNYYLVGSTPDTFLFVVEDSTGKRSSLEIRKDLVDILWSGDASVTLK